ncbi:MAG: bifunctional riboflavin kinase/FAD synthetase [Burkholderiales bacterium]|nr:bifunctional riboflavin kinase/FAD synthetase [Burkholderiales bacterium]
MLVHRGVPSPDPNARHVVTIGNFDGVHLGHQALLSELAQARARHDAPSCVITFEPHPREFFAPQAAPVRLSSLREKLAMLAAHGVDRVQVCRFNRAFASLPAQEFIERVLVAGLGARWVMIGEDFRFGARRAGDLALLRRAGQATGFAVHALAEVAHGDADGRPVRISSSLLRELLLAGHVERAATLLGRPWGIAGRVVRGDRIGRTIGFPTANLRMRGHRPPRKGIYAVRVAGLGSGLRDGVASVGVRPTVTDSGEMRLEVFIFDFDADIYGAQIRVDFLARIRDEEKYADLGTLTRQIERDVQDARRLLAAQPMN